MEDTSRGVICIKPARNPQGHRLVIAGAPKPKAVITKKAKLPRPPNAFILYRQHHHPLVKGQHPDYHNNQICKFVTSVAWT